MAFIGRAVSRGWASRFQKPMPGPVSLSLHMGQDANSLLLLQHHACLVGATFSAMMIMADSLKL